MIFVILGTQKFQLNRLLEELDSCIEEKTIKDDIIAQVGNSTYEPKNYQYEKFLDKDKFDEYISKADVIVTHSGVGSIITSLKYDKPVVVFPRLAKYEEHVDDHQLDIARAFEKKKYVLCCNEDDSIADMINKAKKYKFKKYVSQTDKLVGVVKDFMDKL